MLNRALGKEKVPPSATEWAVTDGVGSSKNLFSSFLSTLAASLAASFTLESAPRQDIRATQVTRPNS